MNTDEKRRFDAIMELCKMSWDRISERRKYEWRIAFAIWGALGSLLVVMLTRKIIGFDNVLLIILLGIAGGIICAIHRQWLKQLQISYVFDRQMAFSDEEELRRLSNTEFSKEFLERLNKRREEMVKFASPSSSISSFYITLLLMIVLLAFIVVSFTG